MHERLRLATVLVLPAMPMLACSQPVGLAPNVELTVLFVGNSLTYANALPDLVRTTAEAAGHRAATPQVALPNFSLEDHWRAGVASVIREVRPDVVVLQQGPSSLPQNQAYLREWADSLATVIEEVGARPALLMVWPDRSRLSAFADVRDAYREAARAIGGIFVPAGQAWLEAWELDPDLALYGPDGFHPSRLGSEVVALTIFRVLFDQSVLGLPDRLEPHSPGLPVIDLGAAAETVKAAVEAAVSSEPPDP